jgi:sugar lactone lactonase YvrE
MKALLIALILAALCGPSAIALDRTHFVELNQKAAELRKKQDWPALREVLIEMGRDIPGLTPRYMLRMASVETHLQHKTEALHWLARYAATGLTYDVAGDEDLKPLISELGFQKIAQGMKDNIRPIHKAEAVCLLPLAGIMPEDIAFEQPSGTFVVSSIQNHTLYRVSLPKSGEKECGISEIPLEDSAKRWPILAVSADSKRDVLWATPSAMPGFAGFPNEDGGKASLLAVNGTSGKIVQRFDLSSNGPAVLGDMSVTADGTVYVSDSIGGGIYGVQGDLTTAKLEKIAGGFFSPQTPALARDGKRLFVADYPLGIAIVDLAHKQTDKLTYLPHPESIAVTGLDGLLLDGNALIGIQNGTEPVRIIRYHLDAAQTKIVSAEVIEQSTERMGEPTHAVAANGMIYVSANVGWNKVDDHGKLKPGEQFTPPVLLRFPAERKPKLQ